ncbi:unnamed protein product [Parnassius mnemosyne]|uniref:Uncharacterized protein n=1 Tax=Parnassius mnemosyne TaxID=213953 RepID=A0AAV1LZY4_9NEOP
MSAFSFATWASESSFLCRDGRNSIEQHWRETRSQGFPKEGDLVSRQFCIWCSDFTLAITLLKDLEAKIYFFLSMLVFTSRLGPRPDNTPAYCVMQSYRSDQTKAEICL